MAVSRMRKIQILAHCGAKEEIVAALREGGALHITEPSVELTKGADDEARRERERELAAELGKLEYLRNFLKPYVPKGKPLENMFKPKLLLSVEELRATVDGFDVESWYQRCIDLEGRMRSAEADIGRREALAQELGHWTGLRMAVEDVGDTRLVRATLLNVEGSDLAGLTVEIAEATTETDLVEISKSGSSVYAVAFFLKDEEAAVMPILKRHNARPVDLIGASGRPEAAASSQLSEADELRKKIEEYKEEATELAGEYDTVLVVLDEVAERLAKKSVEENFGATSHTFLVEGWIRGRDEEALRQHLAATSPEIEIQARDPEKGEQIPIDLTNRALVKPFEFVTTLYGRPVYWEFDPTPLLSPFFILFFGLCLSDAGYGITLAILAFVLGRKMERGSEGGKLMQLLLLGGIATAIVGALGGGWFGIPVDALPGWLRSVVVINPLEEPMTMLNIVFILGIAQIVTGLAIRMVADFKDGRWLDGILDQMVWIVFLLFLVPLGYSFILGGGVPPSVMGIATKGAMIMGITVVATGARKNPKPIMKVLGGVLKLYDIVGYFGDVLSYARLLALGLATAAIAMAINGVAEMAMGIPLAGPVAAVFVILGGHVFNIAVNTLGAFVHSGRLQYLEFFSKFFEGGGRAFTPFKVEKKYSVVQR